MLFCLPFWITATIVRRANTLRRCNAVNVRVNNRKLMKLIALILHGDGAVIELQIQVTQGGAGVTSGMRYACMGNVRERDSLGSEACRFEHPPGGSGMASQMAMTTGRRVRRAFAGYATSGARLLGSTGLRFALNGWQRKVHYPTIHGSPPKPFWPSLKIRYYKHHNHKCNHQR